VANEAVQLVVAIAVAVDVDRCEQRMGSTVYERECRLLGVDHHRRRAFAYADLP
jgi:hypothetical protein